MPTDEENMQYLYVVLTSSGPPDVNFGEVGKALDLKPGAVSKRWSRLKATMNGGKSPGPTAYEFLWLCVKHSNREKAPDWNEIAEKCNTTAGAASKRYSRMKQAFESGASAPKSTPKKTGAGNDGPTTPSKASPAKRKRVTTKKAASDPNTEQDEEQVKVENGESPKKKQRTQAKPRAKVAPKPKAETKGRKQEQEMNASVPPTEATTLIKHDSEMEGAFGEGKEYYDTEQYIGGEEVGDAEEAGVGRERVETWLDEQVI